MLNWLESIDPSPWLGILGVVVAAGLALVWSRLMADAESSPQDLPPMSADWRQLNDRFRER